jgi:AcrR family transcriptional regulator
VRTYRHFRTREDLLSFLAHRSFERVLVFGAMLAQPRQPDPEWDATCRRLLATFLNGLRAC